MYKKLVSLLLVCAIVTGCLTVGDLSPKFSYANTIGEESVATSSNAKRNKDKDDEELDEKKVEVATHSNASKKLDADEDIGIATNSNAVVATSSEATVATNSNADFGILDFTKIIRNIKLLKQDDYSIITEDNPIEFKDDVIFRFDYRLKSSVQKALSEGNDVTYEYQLSEDILALIGNYDELIGDTFTDAPDMDSLAYIGEFCSNGIIQITILATDSDFDELDKSIDIPITINCDNDKIPEQIIFEYTKKFIVNLFKKDDSFFYNTTLDGVAINLLAEKGVLPEKTEVKIEKVPTNDVINRKFHKNDIPSDYVILFDITLYYNGIEIEPNGVVKVQFCLENGTEYSNNSIENVIHINDQNQVELMPCEIDENKSKVIYDAEHFSIYGIVLTTEDIIEIRTPEELSNIRLNLNGSYKLMNDIDLSLVEWRPIDKFTGKLDGNKKTIKGLHNKNDERFALFDQLSGSVINLSFENVKIQSTQNSASLALTTYGDVHIESCNVSGKVHSSGEYVSGLIGYLAGGTLEIKECNVDGNITGGQYIGGITAGQYKFSNNDDKIILINCTNNAEITAVDNGEDDSIYMGGIAGRIDTFQIVDCINTGNVNSDLDNSFLGGIVGYINTHYGNDENLVYSSENTGYVRGSSYTGGIVGYITGYSSQSIDRIITIKNSRNTGKIVGVNIGGIIGGTNVNGKTILDTCYNSGELRTKYCVGGIAGSIGRTVIKDCENIANISAQNSTSGGIVGSVEEGEIRRCNNFGKIDVILLSGSDQVRSMGGIAGSSYQTSIEECYNIGKITLYDSDNIKNYHIGGLVGSNDKGTLTDSYNAGIIMGDHVLASIYPNSIGGILGYTSGKTKLTNCFVYGTVAEFPETDSIGVIIGKAENPKDLDVGELYYLNTNRYDALGNSQIRAQKISKENFLDANTFEKFDFDFVWRIGNWFPIFQWQDDVEIDDPIPTQYELYPENYSTGVSISSGNPLKLRVTFKDIVSGYNLKNGGVSIYEYDTEKLVYETKESVFEPGVCYDIKISGNTIMINLGLSSYLKNFKTNTKYYVNVDEGFVKFDNSSFKIDQKNDWVFSTVIETKEKVNVGRDGEKADLPYNYEFLYKDSFFEESSNRYNHELATWALSVAMSGFQSYEGGYGYGCKNVNDYLVGMLGFKGFDYNYGYREKPDKDSIGVAAAYKTLYQGSEKYTLIIVPIRGAGYEKEWASNFTVGDGNIHEGFDKAKNEVISFLNDYISNNSINGKIKILVTGYSRSAAVTNLTVAALDDGILNNLTNISLDRNDIYGFCFEPPAPVKNVNGNVRQQKYNNIFNIINPVDVVPFVAPGQWGYSHYGVLCYLPTPELKADYSKSISKLKENYRRIGNDNYKDGSFKKVTTYGGFEKFRVYTDVAQGDYLNGLVGKIAQRIGNNQNFAKKYQNDIRNMIINEYTAEGIVNVFGAVLTSAVTGDDIETLLHNIELIAQAHYPLTCLSWMASIDRIEEYSNGMYRKLYVNCPVDVKLYDSSDQLVAYIKDDSVIPIDGSNICAYVDENEQKIMILPYDEEYRIELIVTDNGVVNYSIAEYSTEMGSFTRKMNYNNLPIEVGDILVGTAENLNNDYGKYELKKNFNKIYPNEDLDNMKYLELKVSIDGKGFVYYPDYAMKGEFVKVVGEPTDDSKFIGWFDNNILLSKELEYRFQITEDTVLTAKFVNKHTDELYTDKNPDSSEYNSKWIKDNKGWWYQYSDGTWPHLRWESLNYNGVNKWYYFNEDGYMTTGWLLWNNNWYYLNPISDGTQGSMTTGWKLINNNWYYFDPIIGAMKIGWIKLEDKWYYLRGDGVLLVNATTPDGYYVNDKGEWVQ